MAAPPVPEVPPQTPKPPDRPPVHNTNDMALSHLTNDDLHADALEPRFASNLPRVSMSLPGPIPVSGLSLLLFYIILLIYHFTDFFLFNCNLNFNLIAVDPQRLPLRVGQNSTRVIVGPAGQIIQSLPVQTRIGSIAVAPPPPPYPGPPPPYPGPQVLNI